MLSRALSLATVMFLIGCLAAIPVRAENLDAGKSPSQIFAGTCNACHKSPRGLLKTVPASSLPGFLRQHYTTSSEMAGVLASFLVSSGAADPRYQAKQDQAKQGKDAKPGAEPQHTARPDADGPGAHPGRNAKRLARPGEAPDAAKPAADGQQQQPAQAALTTGPDGRKSAAKQKLGKKGKSGSEEPPKGDAAKEEPAKGEAAKEDTPKSDTAKDEAAKPSGESKSETAKVDAPKETGGETPVLRPDPVPPVTPAPPAEAPSVSAAVSSGSSEPAAAPAQPAAPPAPPPAVTASAPALPPVPPAGPPAPPISQ
ncbi:hypothetical protein KMZ68_11935 [Bradyrhizobium sediminis]|uniref:Cytochrome c domain-containing protein n=1 Tax=Bradyrhizobium sediminis TaxID=2840469 RepID=A0A975NTT6_9BRAD|nr:hypothetical protein [Bradyrhizobium sediminis]QWG20484.1 hypothetical protein KMZ68_11935 [Bradyrhizobium sediminis]